MEISFYSLHEIPLYDRFVWFASLLLMAGLAQLFYYQHKPHEDPRSPHRVAVKTLLQGAMISLWFSIFQLFPFFVVLYASLHHPMSSLKGWLLFIAVPGLILSALYFSTRKLRLLPAMTQEENATAIRVTITLLPLWLSWPTFLQLGIYAIAECYGVSYYVCEANSW